MFFTPLLQGGAQSGGGPTINTHPANATANVGGSSPTFTISATGTGVLHYQWKLDGTNVGADSASYSPTVTSAMQGAQITCVVTDDNGNATSNAATLTVAWTVTGTGPRAIPVMGNGPLGAGTEGSWIRGAQASNVAAFEGAGRVSATGASTLTVRATFVGAGTVSQTGGATFTTGAGSGASFVGAGVTTSAVVAALTTQVAFAGAVVAAATGAAALAVQSTFSASGSAPAAGASTLTVRAALSGSGSVLSSGAAALTARAALSGSGSALSSGASTLTVRAALSGSGSVLSSGTAALTARAALTAAGADRAQGTATLSLQAAFVGFGVAQSKGAAAFTSVPAGVQLADVTMTAKIVHQGASPTTESVSNNTAFSGVDYRGTYSGAAFGTAFLEYPTTNYSTLFGDFYTDFDSTTPQHTSAWLKFSGLSNLPAGQDVLSTELRLAGSPSDSATGIQRITAYRVLRDWTAAGVNWNTYDGTNNWTAGGGLGSGDIDPVPVFVMDVPLLGSSGEFFLGNSGLSKTVEGWQNGTFANYGLLLVASTDQTGDRSIWGGPPLGSNTNAPYLAVTYQSVYVAPVGFFADGTASSNGAATFAPGGTPGAVMIGAGATAANGLATLTPRAAFVGSANVQASGSAALTSSVPFTAAASTKATGGAALTTSAVLAAGASSSASAAAALTAQVALTGAGTMPAAGSASFSPALSFSAAGTAAASSSANLTTGGSGAILTAAAAASAQGAAIFAPRAALVAAANSTSAAAAALTLGGAGTALSGAAAARATAAATLTATAKFAASAAASSASAATLTPGAGGGALIAGAAVSTSASAALTVKAAFIAAASTSSNAAASLTPRAILAGGGFSISTGAGTLTIGGAGVSFAAAGKTPTNANTVFTNGASAHFIAAARASAVANALMTRLVSSVTPTTTPRTYFVSAEDRKYTPTAENRGYGVTGENRGYAVLSEDRTETT
jgi:hypothetical protein